MRIQFLLLGLIALVMGALAPAAAQRQPAAVPAPQIAAPATPHTIRMPVEMAEVMVCEPAASQQATTSCNLQQMHVCTKDEVYFRTSATGRLSLCAVTCEPQRVMSAGMFCVCTVKQSDCR